MTAARKIDPTLEAQASALPASAAPLRKARVARLKRQPVFPPAEVTHRRPIEPEPVTPDPARMERMRNQAGRLVQLLIAEGRMERIDAEYVRARSLAERDREAEWARRQAKADAFFSKDRGADGQAMSARPSQVVQPARDSGAEARQMLDHSPLHWMDLDIRQQEAAAILADTWRDALPAMELPRDFGKSSAGAGDLSAADQVWAARAWQDYQKWMLEVQQRTSLEHANAVRDAVILREPAAAHRVREGLAVLVHLWDLR
ncbi:hypothetical protein BKE38_12490 [Pseudoroseomonas deserti]|uniref:Uncharacterized protein n=1 Tax=Teichococcus deserti TaxID=1817963 RepID=A0A1V2H366_9PROT|nr:hypothetical protein [Pseudoroseomonas deserti]ONG53273.1 hypothetical protein BKE38_12490 [Pseudoroseomonas deserti]